MSSYTDRDTYSQAGDWLLGTVRRNPEALLLMAAGCCLVLRGGRSSSPVGMRVLRAGEEWDYPTGRASSQMRQASASGPEGLARAGESVGDIAKAASDQASRMKERISETARSYAEAADDARRKVIDRSAQFTRQAQSTLQSSTQRVLREQPLAVAIAGLAAGAAVAALFPKTEIEDRAFGDASEKLKDVAEKTGERVMDAAGKVGERLKSAAEERGLTSEGLKQVAGEVAETFKEAMSGSEERGRATPGSSGVGSAMPGSSSATSGSGQAFGMDQHQHGGNQAPNTTVPGGRNMR